MEKFIYFINILSDTMRYNPFNPQQPARPDVFVGREPEIVEFEKFLNQTMHSSPMNMSITGNRGMGKTSLLDKFEANAKEMDCLVVHLSNYEGNITNIIDFVEYITTNIKCEILSHRPLGKGVEKFKDWINTFKPMVGWKDLTLSIEKKQVVQEMFRERLVKLWDEMKSDHKVCVLLIDEAESLEEIGALTFLREVFQRASKNCNYIVVLAGKLNFPERMSEAFSPLNRFFPSYRLSPFKKEEIDEYVIKRLQTVDVKIDEDALVYIREKTEGHPYVLAAVGYLLFDSLNPDEDKITKDITIRADKKIMTKLAEDFFSPMFHPLSPKAKEMIIRIAKNSEGLDFTFKQAVEWTKEKRNYIAPYIQELVRKGVINKPERSRYSVFHTLFLDYLKKQM